MLEDYMGETSAPKQVTVAKMKEYAKNNGISLGKARKKQDIWNVIRQYSDLEGASDAPLETLTVEMPDQEDLSNTNILDFKSNDLLVFEAEDCERWLPDVLKTGKLFAGLEGDIYAYGDSLMKSEFFTEDAVYSVVFMKKLNQFLKKGFPHFVQTYAVYKCGSDTSSDKLITFMENIPGPKIYETKLSNNKLTSIFVQVLMIFVLFLYNGMNHFDLHKDNIILSKTTYKSITYTLGDKSITVPTYGILVKIIDFGNVGFLQSSGKVLLSLPNPLSDYRSSPWYFYQAGIEVFVGGFPDFPGKDEIFNAWKLSNVITYKENSANIEVYKRNTSIDLFYKIDYFFKFLKTKGRSLIVSIVET